MAKYRNNLSRISQLSCAVTPPLTAKEGEKEQYSYSFHVATIKDKQVIQHMLGDIQLPIKVASTYPDGPAE